ncbi:MULTISPECIES: hypothetical protein [unclassified Methylobacterium]|uniref:hypothetical protein n=1 Tax=unclassified Methylobacterium TaxID=2615210 RepID=UPI000CB95ED9|nr:MULTISPECIES: hypothetical protein [unclassified Methylobacterium]PIU04261.1 MAG: hypothetical protein COT56_21075 [Methylobacterium sp. CG09_land_8_20_14_0_10_71_15]PIU12528.1 MAG: hypothetical protein COT28_14675 [Methylobacterium sp. CG08_land_8_20_14_0_20_71_15]GBU16252.1 hypothetical protein AwMethylo_04670 [Methylobacterium sp.]
MAIEMSGRMPEGSECRVDIYLVSDSTEIEVVVGIAGLTVVPAFNNAPGDPLKLVASLGAAAEPLSNIAQDWRYMSRAEIRDYKHRLENPDEDDEL